MSHGFTTFLSAWNITHSTGILYNSQGQATIEYAHSTLKNVILTERGRKYGMLMTPKEKLAQTLF